MLTEADTDIWRALADPSRRRVLDLLRAGPLTTGQLSDKFEPQMSRYGVMKHLGILEQAGLLTVERRGRHRFNHLNAVPIRQLYERWVSQYSDLWSSSLTRLKSFAETNQGTQQMSKTSDFKSFHIVQEIGINAPRDKIWKALTSEIGSWWAFHIGEPGSTIKLDATLGGQFSETWGDGEGALWGTVTYLKRGSLLRLTGALGMKGHGTNTYEYVLEDRDGGTLVKLSHYCHGHDDPDIEKNYTGGWQELLGKYLKGFVEDGKTWEDLKEPST